MLADVKRDMWHLVALLCLLAAFLVGVIVGDSAAREDCLDTVVLGER